MNLTEILKIIDSAATATAAQNSKKRLDLNSYLAAIEPKQLKTEIDSLRTLFKRVEQDPSSMPSVQEEFLERCKERSHELAARIDGPLKSPYRTVNQLYFKLLQSLTGAQKFADLAPYFLPQVSKSLIVSLPSAHAINPRVSIQEGFQPSLSEADLNLSYLDQCIVEDGILFDLRQVARFTFKQHQHLKLRLDRFPAIAGQLYQHNMEFKLLARELASDDSLENILKAFIKKLRSFGFASTGNYYTLPEASLEIEQFIAWVKGFDQASQNLVWNLSGSDKKYTIEYIVFTHLLNNKDCVDTACSILNNIVEHPKNKDMMARSFIPELNSLQNKYMAIGKTTGLNTQRLPSIDEQGLIPIDIDLLSRLRIGCVTDFIKLVLNVRPQVYTTLFDRVNFDLSQQQLKTAWERLPAELKVSLFESLLKSQSIDKKEYYLVKMMIALTRISQKKQILKQLPKENLIPLLKSINLVHRKIKVPYLYALLQGGQVETVRLLSNLVDASQLPSLIADIDKPESRTAFLLRASLDIAHILTSLLPYFAVVCYFNFAKDEQGNHFYPIVYPIIASLFLTYFSYIGYRTSLSENPMFLEELPSFLTLTKQRALKFEISPEASNVSITIASDRESSLAINPLSAIDKTHSFLDELIEQLERISHAAEKDRSSGSSSEQARPYYSPKFFNPKLPKHPAEKKLIHQLHTLKEQTDLSEQSLRQTIANHMPNRDDVSEEFYRLLAKQIDIAQQPDTLHGKKIR